MLTDYKSLPEFDDHELILDLRHEASGLDGFIVIHNSALGPATGGTRYWHYASKEEALRDALKLSRSMTLKCALADVPHGGGKAVIIANREKPKSIALFRAYDEKLNSLNGQFTTGEDVGITHEDLIIMRKFSRYINGRQAGDLGPLTAYGVYLAIKEGLQSVFGDKVIKNRSFAIKGLGKVGTELCRIINKDGGKVFGADIDPETVKRAKLNFPEIEIVQSDEIHKLEVDVFCPCAVGGDIDEIVAEELKCRLVCGAENDQLSVQEIGQVLVDKKILYIPDFVANAGGLINISGELSAEGYNERWVLKKINNISKTVQEIIIKAEELKKPTNFVAIDLALKKIEQRN